MSKILFGVILLLSSPQAFAQEPAKKQVQVQTMTNLTNDKAQMEAMGPCEQAMVAIHKWAVQLEQDASDSKTTGECMKELSFAKQMYPKFTPECAKEKFSAIPEGTQKLWLNTSPWGTTKPIPEVKLLSYSDAFRIEMGHFIEAKCKKKTAE